MAIILLPGCAEEKTVVMAQRHMIAREQEENGQTADAAAVTGPSVHSPEDDERPTSG